MLVDAVLVDVVFAEAVAVFEDSELVPSALIVVMVITRLLVEKPIATKLAVIHTQPATGYRLIQHFSSLSVSQQIEYQPTKLSYINHFHQIKTNKKPNRYINPAIDNSFKGLFTESSLGSSVRVTKI